MAAVRVVVVHVACEVEAAAEHAVLTVLVVVPVVVRTSSNFRHSIKMQYTQKRSGRERCTKRKQLRKTTQLRTTCTRNVVKIDHRGFGMTRVRFAVLDQKVENADPQSPDAATHFPCCLMPCDVICCCSCCCCCL